jgi:Zn-finger protein
MRKSIIINPEHMECAVCGKQRDLEWHHVIHGTANRALSDKYGLTVWLCRECHSSLHSSPHPRWRDVDNQLEVVAQKKFEDIHGHEKWMELFRKNYLDD